MDAEAEAIARAVLDPGERLLWCGRPLPIRGDTHRAWPAIAVAACFVAWPVYAALRAEFHPTQLVVAAAGCVGLGWLLFRPRLPVREVYFVTDRRVVMLRRAWWAR